MDKRVAVMADTILELRPLLYKKFIDKEVMNAVLPKLGKDSHLLMVMLDKQESATMTEISKELYLSKPNVTPLVDKLVASKLVVRVPDEKDRRIVRIAMTKKGREELEWARKRLREHAQKKLSQLSKQDLSALIGAAQTMREILLQIQ